MPVKVGLKVIEIWNDSMEKAVAAYEKEPAKTGQIVFYGPSYFTRWSAKYGATPMHEALTGKSGTPCVINRGFGSSCAEHHLYFYPRMIRPLAPKVLVYASHGNGENFGYSNEETWEIAQRVIAYARADFPDIHIYLCGAAPQRQIRKELLEKRRQYNAWVKEFCDATPNCFYIDPMEYAPLRSDDVFVDDGVHFTPKGYEIYADLFRDALKNELARF